MTDRAGEPGRRGKDARRRQTAPPWPWPGQTAGAGQRQGETVPMKRYRGALLAPCRREEGAAQAQQRLLERLLEESCRQNKLLLELSGAVDALGTAILAAQNENLKK